MDRKRILPALLAALSLSVALPAFAAEETGVRETVIEGQTVSGTATLADSETLLTGYILRAFDMATEEVGTYGSAAREQLNELEKYIYDALAKEIEKVAEGELSSTEFVVSKKDGYVSVTVADLADGETLFDENGEVTTAAAKALREKFYAAVDVNKLRNALVADHPYELYWYDKTGTTNLSFRIASSETKILMIGHIWKLPVSPEYQDENATDKTHTADVAKTGATKTAVENAKAIVAKYAGKTDYEKLVAYRDEICELVEYDYDAANTGSVNSNSKAAWQIISVFDGDPTTNVVCEGYGRAFQYLCEQSTFTGDVECYSVTGVAGLGAKKDPDTDGGHLWNVVAIDGKNYLVDVKNTDGEAVGKDGKSLFLAGGAPETGDEATYRVTTPYGDMYYTYYEKMKDFYCTGYPALSATAYTPPVETKGEYPTLAAGSSWYKSKIRRDTITSVTFVDSYSGTADETWAADAAGKGDITCYRTGTALVVAGNGTGKIKLNANSSFLFGNDNATTSVRRFARATTIEGLGLLDTSEVTNMKGMFYGCRAVTELDLSGWDISKVKNLNAMFYGCGALKRVDLSGWDTSNVTDMGSLFYECAALEQLDLSHFKTDKLTVMGCLFYGCASLNALDLSGWNTGNVRAMGSLFAGCSSLTTLDLSAFNTAGVTMMNYMFSSCTNLRTIYVSANWSTKKLGSGLRMFLDCKSLAGKKAYTLTETDQAYANTDGYLTFKNI